MRKRKFQSSEMRAKRSYVSRIAHHAALGLASTFGYSVFADQSPTISFDRDIRPIFEQTCFRCHGPQNSKSDFRLDVRSEALKGGNDNTNDIVPGHSETSKLIAYVSRTDPEIQMPPSDRGKPLTSQQIQLLRQWIDQGAGWGTNAAPSLAFSVQPSLRWIDVHGDKKKFRELEGITEGAGGGIDQFSATEQISPDKTVTVKGHVHVPENDVKLNVTLDKKNVGFIHGGFEEWRKYYDDTGGYYPGFTPSTYSLNRDLHLDIGRFWIDFGVTLPDEPKLVVGYEYQFRNGTKSMLDWGTVNFSKNIYPNAEDIDEHTHIFKVEVSDEWNGWDIQDRARLEVYQLNESRNEVTGYSGGPLPDSLELMNQRVHYVLGANTFRVERQIADWWLASGGALISHYDGTSLFSQTATDGTGAPGFGTYWRTEGITLSRDSRVVSIASLFLPAKGLSLSTAGQVELTHEDGFGNVDLDVGDPAIPLPGFFTAYPGTVSANQDRTEFSETVDAKYSRLPRSVLFANARLRQESVGQFDEETTGSVDDFQQRTDAFNHSYDARAGFTTSSWTWIEWGGHARRRDSISGYNHLMDNSPFGGAGYPAFITHREIVLNELEGRIVLRPLSWLTARLTYDYDVSDYNSITDPVSGGISPGGAVWDGRMESHNAGLNLTLTPIQRLYLSGTFTYGWSRTLTTAAASPEVVPYEGNTVTINTSAGYALNEKTEFNVTYLFSEANYGQNNTAGVPLGLDFARHNVFAGLTRKFTNKLTGGLRYGFFEYSEPSSAHVNDYVAHGIFATLAYQWP